MSADQKKTNGVYWVIFFGAMAAAFFCGLLVANFAGRQKEHELVFKPQIPIQSLEPRSSLWGKNYPREYESYLKTADTSFRSRYNGNAEIDMLAIDPRLVILWAGYPFSKDYKQSRGHFYTIQDLYQTLRTGAPKNADDGPMSSTCWTCKSPDVPRMMKKEGIAQFYTGTWARLGPEIINPLGCADCHDEKTMNLTITRPALIEAFQRQGKNIRTVTHQEMRSLVCAQCHVEYFMDKRADHSNYLTFPWDKGLTCEQIEAYYDSAAFSDWEHGLSRAPMIKAQHPDYELFQLGIHAQRGLSCADCHMPFMSQGGQKYTDHHIESPLHNIENTCQICHKESTEQLVKDVYERQDKIIENRDKLEVLLVRAHQEAKTAWDHGASKEQMKDILRDIRHAQWRWDFSAATHGGSFHAPLEIGRIISTALVIAQESRIKLSRLLVQLGVENPVEYPEITTKAVAQLYIGLDMPKLQSEKDVFLQTLVPQWLQQAQAREAGWDTQTGN